MYAISGIPQISRPGRHNTPGSADERFRMDDNIQGLSWSVTCSCAVTCSCTDHGDVVYAISGILQINTFEWMTWLLTIFKVCRRLSHVSVLRTVYKIVLYCQIVERHPILRKLALGHYVSPLSC